MSKNEDKKATNLTEYFKENIHEIMKYLIELYEFQEDIKFVNSKIEYIEK